MDNEVGPWKMAFFHGPNDGPTFIVQFLNTSIYKAFGPLNRFKPNVDQEEQPCIKDVLIFIHVCPKRVILTPKNIYRKYIITAFQTSETNLVGKLFS